MFQSSVILHCFILKKKDYALPKRP